MSPAESRLVFVLICAVAALSAQTPITKPTPDPLQGGGEAFVYEFERPLRSPPQIMGERAVVRAGDDERELFVVRRRDSHEVRRAPLDAIEPVA